MKNYGKYKKQYFPAQGVSMDWAKKEYVETPPIWCSVDLRDGNQALIIPMSLSEKLEFFKLLCDVGFKEIEIGFPAANAMISGSVSDLKISRIAEGLRFASLSENL